MLKNPKFVPNEGWSAAAYSVLTLPNIQDLCSKVMAYLNQLMICPHRIAEVTALWCECGIFPSGVPRDELPGDDLLRLHPGLSAVLPPSVAM